MRYARLVRTLFPVLLCAIPQAVRAGTITETVTYTLTQDLPSLDGDTPTFTWTTGPLDTYVADGGKLPFFSDPVLNTGAKSDGYVAADTPEVVYEGGSFVEVFLYYSYGGDLYQSTNEPGCAAGSDEAGCTFTVAVDYQGPTDPSGFAPDPLALYDSGAPEPATLVLAFYGVFGLLVSKRRRPRNA